MKKELLLVLFFVIIIKGFGQIPSCKKLIGLDYIDNSIETRVLDNNETITMSNDSIRKYDNNYNLIFKITKGTIRQIHSHGNKFYTMGSMNLNTDFIDIYNENNVVSNTIIINKDSGTTRLDGGFFDIDENGFLYIFSTSYEYGVGWYHNLYKYDENGNFLWKKEFNSNGATTGNLWLSKDFSFDNIGNIYFSGMFYNTLTLDSYSINGGNNSNYRYLLLLKLNSNGDVLNLVKKHFWNGTEPISTIVDGNNYIYVVGSYLSYSGDSDYDGIIEKYNNNLNLEWQQLITQSTSTPSLLISDVQLKGDELIFVGTGNNTGNINFNNGFTLPGNSYIASYDLNGNTKYVKSIIGGTGISNFVLNDKLFVYGNANGIVEIDSQNLSHNGFFIGEISNDATFEKLLFYSNNNVGIITNQSNVENYINSDLPIRFKVSVFNELSQNLPTLSGTITTSTNGVTITDNTASFNNIASGQSEWSTDEFEIIVDSTVPNGTLLEFELSTQDQIISGGPWLSSFSFPLAPLDNGIILLDDDSNPDSNGDNDNIPEPGETIEILPTLNNVSNFIIHDVNGQLIAEQNFINVWDNVAGVSGTVYNTQDYNIISNQQEPINIGATNVLPRFDYVFDYPSNHPLQELNFNLIIEGRLGDSDGTLIKWTTSFLYNEGITGVLDNVIGSKIYLTPNPTHSILNIYTNDNIEIDGIHIYNLEGRKLQSYPIGTNQISINNFSNGTYIMMIKTKKGISFHRIIKE